VLPSGGGSESPSGNTGFPPTSRFPLEASIEFAAMGSKYQMR
jgi:hypothetical protein